MEDDIRTHRPSWNKPKSEQLSPSAERKSIEDYMGPGIPQIIEGLQIGYIVERTDLMNKVKPFIESLNESPRALFIIGEAGVGKTTFSAHLVRSNVKYLYLFGHIFKGSNSIHEAQLSLGAQLVTKFRLGQYSDPKEFFASSQYPSFFLNGILNSAAERLPAGEKLVIVCDGIDEAGVGENGNVFGLPTKLPKNVCLILTMRPISPTPISFDPKVKTEKIVLKANDQKNLEIIEQYLKNRFQHSENIRSMANEQGYSEAQFIRLLREKSDGLWMYLSLILEDIERSEKMDLSKLPQGLPEYYENYWSKWRINGRMWKMFYAPLLATLAAAQQPLPIGKLLEWSGINQEFECEIKELIQDCWPAYIRYGNNGYAFYHASFRDFFTANVDRLPDAVGFLAIEMRDYTREAHRRIVKLFYDFCGREWARLVNDDYARQYLTLHLAEAGQLDELYKLVIESSEWGKARYDQEDSYIGFFTDIERIWGIAEKDETWCFERQIRCALIHSSIMSQNGNIPPKLIVQLVSSKRWKPIKALAHISLLFKDEDRSEALIGLMEYQPDELLLDELFPEALQIVKSITKDELKTDLLLEMIIRFNIHLKVDLLEIALELTDEKNKGKVLCSMVEHIPDQYGENVLQLVIDFQDEKARAESLCELVKYLPDKKNDVFQAILAMKDENIRAGGLSQLAAIFPDEYEVEVRNAAWEEIKDWDERESVFRALARIHLDKIKSDHLTEVLTIPNDSWRDEHWKACLLSELANRIPEERNEELLEAAFSFRSKYERMDALRGISKHLPDVLISKAWEKALRLVDPEDRAIALRVLLHHLPEEAQQDGATTAYDAAQQISDDSWRAWTIHEIFYYLPENIKTNASIVMFQASDAVTNPQDRSRILEKALPYLPEVLIDQRLKGLLSRRLLICRMKMNLITIEASMRLIRICLRNPGQM